MVWYIFIPAAQMAIELINNHTSILREYDLVLLENDTSCDSSIVLKIFTEYVRDDNVWRKMVGGLGKLVICYSNRSCCHVVGRGD